MKRVEHLVEYLNFNQYNFLRKSKISKIIYCILLSWFYAFCSQIIIPIPFNFVPISLQPLPLFLAAIFWGRIAVFAFMLTILQTAIGAPFFSGFQGGIAKLVSPTGGYILGFLVAMIFLAMTRNFKNKNLFITFLKIIFANALMYLFGLAQLSLFVPFNKLLSLGLYPFMFGCFVKTIVATLVTYEFNKKVKI
ncbi:biotin transporter BioY [Candidatus Dependentiae bacterium]